MITIDKCPHKFLNVRLPPNLLESVAKISIVSFVLAYLLYFCGKSCHRGIIFEFRELKLAVIHI